jgi:hypothetical protein
MSKTPRSLRHCITWAFLALSCSPATNDAGPVADDGLAGKAGGTGPGGSSAGVAGSSGGPASQPASGGGAPGGVSGGGDPGGAPGGRGGADAPAGGATGGAGSAGAGSAPARGGAGGTGGATGGTGGAIANADCKGLHYCETFESHTVGMAPGAPWKTSLRGGATLVVDATKPFGGGKSMHITAPAGNSAAALINQRGPALPVPTNNIFGRAMVFFGGAAPRNTHFPLFELQGVSPVAGNVIMRWGGNGIGPPRPPFHFNYKWTKPTASETSTTSKIFWQGGKWLCIQWQFDGSDAGAGMPKNEARIWVDGAPVNEMTVLMAKGWNFATPWTFMQLGFQYFQTTPDATELWIDDFALNSTMVPCPPKP